MSALISFCLGWQIQTSVHSFEDSFLAINWSGFVGLDLHVVFFVCEIYWVITAGKFQSSVADLSGLGKGSLLSLRCKLRINLGKLSSTEVCSCLEF